jgi:hypothetical protein
MDRDIAAQGVDAYIALGVGKRLADRDEREHRAGNQDR